MHLYVQPTGGKEAHKIATDVLKHAFTQPWEGSHQDTRPANSTNTYIMFFDGGSRGNPGPGGAGAVVARTDMAKGTFHLVWAASMSYAAKTTTNNLAENLGLLVGLGACAKRGYSPLHVVGDSAMIIRQHRTRNPPKAPHLKPLYWRCRRLMTKLKILTWQHHFRVHNKMADMMANKTMDRKKSNQTLLDEDLLNTDTWRPLAEVAGGDVGHWMLTNMEMAVQTAEVAVP